LLYFFRGNFIYLYGKRLADGANLRRN